jgi:hypothetical protein
MNITKESRPGLPASKIRTRDTLIRSKCTKSGAFLNQDRQWLLWRRHSSMDRAFYCAESECVMLLSRINYYYYLIEIQMVFFTRWQWCNNNTQHKNTRITQNNTPCTYKTAHEATQTITVTLHTTKAIPITGPPLWSSGQSSWLQIQSSGFNSRHYQIFWEVVGLERGPHILVNTIEELLGRKSSGSCLEHREYGRGDPSRWPRGTLYPQKLALTSPTSGGRSVGIVHSRTQAREFNCSFIPTTGRRGLWHVTCRRSHIVQTIVSQMAVRLWYPSLQVGMSQAVKCGFDSRHYSIISGNVAEPSKLSIHRSCQYIDVSSSAVVCNEEWLTSPP